MHLHGDVQPQTETFSMCTRSAAIAIVHAAVASDLVPPSLLETAIKVMLAVIAIVAARISWLFGRRRPGAVRTSIDSTAEPFVAAAVSITHPGEVGCGDER